MLGKGRYINYPEVDTCINDIKQVMGFRDINGVNLHDDVLTLNKAWFRKFCKQYSEHIGLPFMCNLRIGTFTEEDVKILKDANCRRVIIGIESGSEYMRNNILRKEIGTNRDIIDAFKLCHKYGITTFSQNMVGIPEENFERFYDTVKINAQILPNAAAINVYYPYPGTALYNKAKKEGLIVTNYQPYNFLERKESILDIQGFKKKKIEFYARYFKQMIYLEVLFSNNALGRNLRKYLYRHYFLQVFIFSLLEMITRSLKLKKLISIIFIRNQVFSIADNN